tara:strand:+ start:538 stop:1029 length:492 start_codon:yes stop_codon:yes gene_type:complete
MSITSQLSGHGSGYRARFIITLADGREIHRGPIPVANQAAADARAITLEADVIVSIIERDTEEAVDRDNAIVVYRSATAKQIARQFLKRAFLTNDPIKSYRRLKKFNDYRTARGWTVAQTKSQLNINDAQWSRLVAKWVYLSDATRLQTMQDYNLITHVAEDF